MALLLAIAARPAAASEPFPPDQGPVAFRFRYPAEAAPPVLVNADATAACYPLTRPTKRRRAVGKGGPPCASNPTVHLTVAQNACEGEAVRVSWQASEPNARVHIQGVACDLPASGSTTVIARPDLTLRAIATTCGVGPEMTASVTTTPPPLITSFTAEHERLAPYAATTLHFTYEHGTEWAVAGADAFDGPLAGENAYGGSVRAWFEGVPAAPVLSVTGPCGTAVAETLIGACLPSSPPIDIGGASGRVAVGQSQRLSLLLAPEVAQWLALTDNGTFSPATGSRPGSGEVETVYTPAHAGEATLRFLADDACGIRGYHTIQTVWNCGRPLIESFTAGATTLAVGQSTYVSYVTQERHSEVGNVSSALGNALGGVVHDPWPENRHTYTATRAGIDTVTLEVATPCGPATASLQIMVR
jgi:hypothetical protein